MPVPDERSLDENLEYLSSIQWDKRMGFFASKEIAEYFDWLDYNIFETK